MQGLADVVRFVPGATMGQGEGHRDAPTIRGNSSTADFFVDGVRDDAQFVRDLYNVDRVEVLGGANAMIFGRGGGGGVINRVTRRAQWEPTRSITLEGGSFGHARGTIDVGGAWTDAIASRMNGVHQRSRGFRDEFVLRRFGVSPSVSVVPGARSRFGLDAEYFEDHRRVDRGLPSFQGRPSDAPIDVHFGNPDSSYSAARVVSATTAFEHQASDRVRLRAQGRVVSYDKFYQNVLPGAMDVTGSQVVLSAYNSDSKRRSLFGRLESQIGPARPGANTLLLGVEVGRQHTDNVRLTGYFNGTDPTLAVPFDAPTVRTPISFRAAGSDADGSTVAAVASVYAQDQLDAGSRVRLTLGGRLERFQLEHSDRRTGQILSRTDDMFSPRIGLVLRARPSVSGYASFSVAHLPSSGDQFAGLTVTTQTLAPERFRTTEVGLKFVPRDDAAFTAAVYENARSNAAAPSALDPGVVVQTGRQETRGLEMSASGRIMRQWDAVAAVAFQRAFIARATTAAPAGKIVPLVPRRTFSAWNRFQVTPSLGLAFGAIGQDRMYAAIDNTVTLPGFWRLDAAAYLRRIGAVALQANFENLLDTRYYATSHGNNNIMPGAPRTVRVSATVSTR